MAKNKKKGETDSSYYKPNIWASIRDISLAAINKGQFPVLLMGSCMVILLCRLPSSDLSKFAHELLEEFRYHEGLGWIGTVLLSTGWWMHARFQRKTFEKEMRRIAAEKKGMQEKGLDKRLGSSDYES
jgi:hypothetical protein